MRIATWVDQNVGNAYVSPKLLPSDYTTIDKITRLDDHTLKHLINNGTICPTLRRNEISKVLRLARVNADEQRVLKLVPIRGKFRTIGSLQCEVWA